MRNPIETVFKSTFFIYVGMVFWVLSTKPSAVVEDPSTVVTVSISALASGFFVYGIIVFIANVRIGKNRKGIEDEIQKNIDNAFNKQKELENSLNPKKEHERKS